MSETFTDLEDVPIGIPIFIKQTSGKIFIGTKHSNGEFCGTSIGYYKDDKIHLYNGDIINNVSQWRHIIISGKEG